MPGPINGKSVFIHNWYNRGIIFVADLIKENGEILCYEEFCTIYNFRPNFLLFHGLIRNIKHFQIDVYSPRLVGPTKSLALEILLKNKKGCKSIYEFLLAKVMVKSTYISKWNNELNIENEVNWWHKVNQSIFKLKDKK